MKSPSLFAIRQLSTAYAVSIIVLACLAVPPAYAMTWQTELLDVSNTGDQGYEPLGSDSLNPKIILDAADRPHVFFTRQANGTTEDTRTIYMFNQGSSWQNVTIGSAYLHPRIQDAALDASGNPHVLYWAGPYGHETIRHAYLTGSVWHDVDIGKVFGNKTVLIRSAVIDSHGYIHVLYSQLAASDINFPLKYARFSFNGQFSINETIDNRTGFRYEGDIAVDSGGNPRVIYVHGDFATTNSVYYATRTGTGWTRKQIDTVRQSRVFPRIEIDTSGHPNMMYVYDSPVNFTYVHRNASGWTYENVEYYGTSPSFALDRNDVPYLSSYHSNRDLWVSWRNTSGWTYNTVSYPYHNSPVRPCVAVDSTGRVHLVTREPLTPTGRIPAGIRYYIGADLRAPVANFTASPRSGIAPLTVRFTDMSENTPKGWNWTFGDSSIVNSTMKNPVHTYTKAGIFPVSLNATNAAGSNRKTIARYITVYGVPVVTGVSPRSGPTWGGMLVTVTGMNFTGATTVRFGAIAGTNVTVLSNTKLTLRSPSHVPAIVDVTVKTPAGTSATTALDGFTYAARPTVTGISPAGGPVAGGTVVTINGTGFTDVRAVLFGSTQSFILAEPAPSGEGSPVNGPYLQADTDGTGITVISPPHAAGVVNISVRTAGGTSAATPAATFSYSA